MFHNLQGRNAMCIMNEGVVILAGGTHGLEQLVHYKNAPAKKRSGLKPAPRHYITVDGQEIPNGLECPPIMRRPAEYSHCFFTSASGIRIPAQYFIDIEKAPDSNWEEKMPSWRSPNSDSAKYRRRQFPGPSSLRKMG